MRDRVARTVGGLRRLGGLARRLEQHQERLDQQAARLDRQRELIDALRQRVRDLEAETQENRRLNKRVAEVTDIVAEVLVPAGNRDDAEIRRRLDAYAETL